MTLLCATGCVKTNSEYITIYKPRLICEKVEPWTAKEQAALLVVFHDAAPALTDTQNVTTKAIKELSSLRAKARKCEDEQKKLEQESNSQ